MSTEDEPIPGSCIIIEEPQENAEEDGIDNGEEQGQGLSKRQLRKLQSREKWLKHRKEHRIVEKEKRKNKRKALKEAGQGETLKRIRAKPMAESISKIRVAVDMSFDSLMSEKDCRRAVLQINWCYSANRKIEQPLQFYVVGFNDTSRDIYNSVETNKNQDIYIKDEFLDQVFNPSEIVYLTADSENVLASLDESKVYVIGGLVDHNSHKGICFELAQKKGYGHARLPIDEFVNMKTRKVLTINHVFEILVQYSQCNDWEKSFFAVMPQRKGMTKKEEDRDKEVIEGEAIAEEEK